MVFDYLDICISEQNNENPKNFPVLEFNDIRGDEVTFEIQEINVYRRLAHLSLRLRKGNDAKVREHLGECLKQLKLEHTNALKKLQDTQTLLENSQLQYESMQVEFENQKKAFTERDLSYKTKLSKEIYDERERAAKAVADATNTLTDERQKLIEQHATDKRILENRIAALDYDCRDLTEKKHQNEAQLQRLREEQRNSNEEIQRQRIEIERNRKDHNNLDQEKNELVRNLSQLQTQVQVFNQEKNRITIDLKRQDDAYQDLLNQKTNLTEELCELKKKVTKRETTIRNVSQELVKANDIIQKLQQENRKNGEKIKIGCQIIQKQERAVEDKSQELENTRKQLKDKTEEVIEQQTNVQITEKRLEDAQNNIDDLSHKIEIKERTIQWLNKQLTQIQERHPNIRLGPPPEGLNFTASAMASTSTPIGRPQQKENKFPRGLDPKYLEPSPTLAAKKPSVIAARNNNTTPKGGLLRQNLSPRNVTSPSQQAVPPQSVYFAKT